MKCNQAGCDQRAVYRYAWPGRPEAGICNGHPEQTAAIIAAMVPLNLCYSKRKRGAGKVAVDCASCGETFMAKVYDIKRGWGRFCSKICKAAAQGQRRKENGRY